MIDIIISSKAEILTLTLNPTLLMLWGFGWLVGLCFRSSAVFLSFVVIPNASVWVKKNNINAKMKRFNGLNRSHATTGTSDKPKAYGNGAIVLSLNLNGGRE